MKLVALASTIASCVFVSAASASPITSPADPALDGSTLVDFESETVGVYYAYQGGYTTTTGQVNFYAARLYLDASPAIAGLYNTTGRVYLTNGSPTKLLNINFPYPVTAFGFNFGASDVTWTMTAYDANNAAIETVLIPRLAGSNAGEFFGIAASEIVRVTLQQGAGMRAADVIFLDNLKFR